MPQRFGYFWESFVHVRAVDWLFARFDLALKEQGYLTMGDQIINATVVPATKQHNTEVEKVAIKEDCVPEDWKPAKAHRKIAMHAG